jgi:Tol biopolymer transport system component
MRRYASGRLRAEGVEMRRRGTTILPLALLCLLSGGCATLTGTGSDGAVARDPSTAIALSVLSDSIYLVDPATGRRAEIVGGLLDFRSGFAAWAPDHRRLAYANHSIQAVDLTGDSQSVLVQGDDLSMPSWSPQGDQVVYGDGTSVWRTRPGRDPTRLRTPSTLAPLGMDWGRNGLIAFQGLTRDCSRSRLCPSTDRSEIWVLHPDGDLLEQITNVGHAESPKWSPDGSRILFIRRPLNAPGDARELWMVNADGSGAGNLGDAQTVVAADWSPDGLRLAMVTAATPQTLQLWIAEADGTEIRPLGEPVAGTEATVDW